MSIDPETREALDRQLQEARQLLTSDEWRVWSQFLRTKRRGYLQNKLNESVEKGDIVQAQICKALMDDCIKMLDLFSSFLKEADGKLKEK